jgi:hypothetical protein
MLKECTYITGKLQNPVLYRIPKLVLDRSNPLKPSGNYM